MTDRLERTLQRLTGPELAMLARARADEARQNDARMDTLLRSLLTTVDEMSRRLDRDE